MFQNTNALNEFHDTKCHLTSPPVFDYRQLLYLHLQPEGIDKSGLPAEGYVPPSQLLTLGGGRTATDRGSGPLRGQELK